MTRRDLVRNAAIAALGTSLGGCQFLGLEWRYRYRLIAEVARAGERYIGSSVSEVVRRWGPTGIGGRARGEATPVDIPGAGTLFLLRAGQGYDVDWPYSMPHKAFADKLGSQAMVDPELLTKLTRMTGEIAEVSPSDYPMMVRFRDPTQPATVELVTSQALDVHFGDGVKFERLMIQITQDSTSDEMIKLLPWLPDHIEKHLDGTDANYTLVNNRSPSYQLSSGFFSTEFRS